MIDSRFYSSPKFYVNVDDVPRAVVSDFDAARTVALDYSARALSKAVNNVRLHGEGGADNTVSPYCKVVVENYDGWNTSICFAIEVEVSDYTID